MILLLGETALSPFRCRKLIKQLQQAGVETAGLETRWAYFAESRTAVDEITAGRLQRLLSADIHHSGDDASGLFLVVPRLGTQSPWSSKATDIAQRCGFDSILRIERGMAVWVEADTSGQQDELIAAMLHDRMTQSVLRDFEQAGDLFFHGQPSSLQYIPLLEQGEPALADANARLGLALSDDEIDYLAAHYLEVRRDPTDAELMMFAQANSEHCRHKIFNAQWTVDGEPQKDSLFGMIKNTYRASPEGVLSAYHDNAAVLAGPASQRFFPGNGDQRYHYVKEPLGIQIKVETHNHPTAISPFSGAATGSGGEIRDEAATGRGAKPKAGLCGFSVSNLRLPEAQQAWELPLRKPDRIASALDIMLEGPIGAAAFNNEFGRPALGGYFRSFEFRQDGRNWGYHKPIMVAGGMGNIRPQHVEKLKLPAGAPVLVLGGPAMLIGLGGGAASSMGSGSSDASLDFASVQRDNPEMQRRAQEVIDHCWAMGDDNPILSIHDVGAGGLSNALPELLHDSGRGGVLEIREVPSADRAMSPMQIWCNEAQERYVLAVAAEDLPSFQAICQRERCPQAVVGHATEAGQLQVLDRLLQRTPVDLPLQTLLGKPPKMKRDAVRSQLPTSTPDFTGVDLTEAIDRVLMLPAVASKQFLITIGDRSVGGLVARDQMVGPWQIPVADAAVTLSGFQDYSGEAMAMGERTPLAIVNAPASGRMAVAEAITNIAAAPIARLSDVKLSANWMAAAGTAGQDAALFDTVRAVGMELCPQLGIAIPVGKDSLSMRTLWQDDEGEHEVRAPLSLIVSAFAPVSDARKALTPQLNTQADSTCLLLVDLGRGANRIAGSALAQVYGEFGSQVPDLDDPRLLSGFFTAVQSLNQAGRILAYHDRSDGGVLQSLLEMAFAAQTGLSIHVPAGQEALSWLFSEEAGAVIQVKTDDLATVIREFEQAGLAGYVQDIAAITGDGCVTIQNESGHIYRQSLTRLQQRWNETSWRLYRLRDNPQCADAEHQRIAAGRQVRLQPHLTFDPEQSPLQGISIGGSRPRVAILREQGVNGQTEMAAGFHAAGFDAVDVHMSDLMAGRRSLDEFQGFVACGGFSYGDVLGAGRGWARSILFRQPLRQQFARFLSRDDRFALGVCNGCQMLSVLAEIIPGTDHWPRFVRNRSEQFEARLSLVEITPSPSLFFTGMEGSRIPVATAHGEGRAEFTQGPIDQGYVSLRYVEADGAPAEEYPANPNGSPGGVTGLCNADGRVTILMPHPERTLRSVNFSWYPEDLGPVSPWQRMFENARRWVET